MRNNAAILQIAIQHMSPEDVCALMIAHADVRDIGLDPNDVDPETTRETQPALSAESSGWWVPRVVLAIAPPPSSLEGC